MNQSVIPTNKNHRCMNQHSIEQNELLLASTTLNLLTTHALRTGFIFTKNNLDAMDTIIRLIKVSGARAASS